MVKIILITGNGRGKTSTAMGHAYLEKHKGKKLVVVQFLKTGKNCGECNQFKNWYQLRWFNYGKSEFYVSKKQLKEFRSIIQQGIVELSEELNRNSTDILVLDELGVALSYDLVKWTDLQTVIKTVDEEVVITGRNIPETIKKRANEVITVDEIKHPYNAGILARKGIDY
jgi:cob(I)alamin adenosyltransferase